MSQFQIEGGGRAGSIVRGGNVAIPRVGVTETLQAPGLAVAPLVESQGQQIARTFLLGVHSVGTVANSITGIRSNIAAEEKAAEREREAEEKELATVDRGHGSYYGQTQQAALSRAVLDGEIRPADGQTAEDFAQALIDSRTQGLTPAAREGYARVVGPTITDALAARHQRIENANREQVNKFFAAGASADGTVPGITQNVDEYLKFNPDATRTMALSDVALPALRRAANDGGMPGSKEKLEAAAEVLGPAFVNEIAEARARHTETSQRAAQVDDERGTQGFFDLVNRGASKDAADEYLNQKTNGLLPNTIARLREFSSTRAAQQLHKTQGIETNNFVRDVLLKKIPADKVAEEAARRAELPETDPQFMDADRLGMFIDRVTAATQFDVRLQKIDQDARKLGQNVGGITPLIVEDDEAAQSWLVGAGILTGEPDAHGKVSINGIANPTGLATMARHWNRVPDDVAHLVAAGLDASDPAQVQDASVTWAALYLQSPTLAAGLPMSESAKLRAAYIAAGIQRQGPELLTDPARLRSFVSELAKPTVKMDQTLVDYTKEQALGRVLKGDSAAASTIGAGFYPALQVQARKDISAYVFDDAMKAEGDFRKSHLFGLIGNSKLENVPANVTETYLKHLDQQFRVYRSILPDEAAATTAAKKAAIEQTFYDHPPQAWNGSVFFGQRGSVTTPEDAIVGELMTAPIGAVDDWDEQVGKPRLAELLNGFVPEWDGKGYVFRSLTDPTSRYIHWANDAVGPLRITLDPESDFKNLQQKINTGRKARAAQKAAEKAAATPGGQFMQSYNQAKRF